MAIAWDKLHSQVVSSLVPRAHLAHARRRDLVSQVLGLASEVWSNQLNHRVVLI